MIDVRTLFITHSIIAAIFGVGFVLAPNLVVSYYGADLTEAGELVGRLFGSAVLTYAVVLWLARDSEDSTARRAILKGFFVPLLIGAVVSFQGVLAGTVNALGWSTVLIYVALAFWYGFLAFRQTGSVGD